jgi:GNAT superfamily N-acetyltransferase
MKITTEERFQFRDLEKRIDPEHRVFLVQNSPRGIKIQDGPPKRESWCDLGFVGDGRRNRWAIEVRARNGRVIAAVAWWVNPHRDNCVSTLGTYVSKKLRRRGIGTSLWKAMISATGATKIYSEPVTDEGLTLVESLRDKLKGTEIEYIDHADLVFLEDLRAMKRKSA